MSTGILDFENESLLTGYPIYAANLPKGLFTDARFQQFDDHTPILQTVTITNDYLELVIKFDLSVETVRVLRSSVNSQRRTIEIKHSNDRILGKLTFGSNFALILSEFQGRKLVVNTAFNPETVLSVDSSAALFSLDSLIGSVTITNTSSDDTFFINSYTTGLTFNAVKNHKLPDSLSFVPLKQINLQKPVNNNIFLSTNDIVKLISQTSGGLQISLVSTVNKANALPTLIA